MMKQLGIRKIPRFPNYKISKDGFVQVKSGRLLKEKVDLKGAFVRLRKEERIYTCYVFNLLQKTFKEKEDFNLIIDFLELKKAEGVRVLWKLEEDRVKCKVNYQGIGTLQRISFDIFSLRDAKVIFKKFAPKWKPYRKYKSGA